MPQRHDISLLAAILLLAGCAQGTGTAEPPKNDFYFPISVATVETIQGKPVLYVVSTNFDLRYSRGTVLAVDTAKLSEPPDGPVDKAVDPNKGWAFIDNFGGEIAYYSKMPRLFVPTRYANRLYALGVDGATLSCLPTPTTPTQDCIDQGILLQDPTDHSIQTVDPFGVAIDGSKVYITQVHPTDSPLGSGKDLTVYLAHIDAENLGVPGFDKIGLPPTEGIAVTPRGTYLGGLALSGTLEAGSQALRLFVNNTVTDVGLTTATHIEEARSLAVSTDGTRLFVATRNPDGLLVLDISPDPATGLGRNRVLSFTTLPASPSATLVIPRKGRDLVAISCTAASTVALYDDELGETTGLVTGIQEPFGLAKSTLPGNSAGARLFVASFGNHTVDVIDIADVTNARTALLVGHLGFGAHRPLGVALPEDVK